MRKLIITLVALFLTVSGVYSADNLFEYYQEQGLNLPSVEERIDLAMECGISDYHGSTSQNIALKACLEADNQYLESIDIVSASGGESPNIDYVETEDFLGAVAPFRPSEFKTSLAQTFTEGHSGTTLKVNSITTKDNNTLDPGVLGDTIVLHIAPGRTNAEIVTCTGLTTGTKTFSGCTFGYRFDKNATASGNIKAHAPGETVIISNDDHYLSTQYPTIDGENILTGANYFASSTVDVVKLHMTSSTLPYFWANKATGQIGWATSTDTEFAFNSGGTSFATVNPMTLISGELRVATNTAWFNLDDQDRLSVSTTTNSNADLFWKDSWNATTTKNLAFTFSDLLTTDGGFFSTASSSIIGTFQVNGSATTTGTHHINELCIGNQCETTAGSKWMYSDTTSQTVENTTDKTTLYTFTLPGGTLGSNGILKLKMIVGDFDYEGTSAGGSGIDVGYDFSSWNLTGPTGNGSDGATDNYRGSWDAMIIATSTTALKGFIDMKLLTNPTITDGSNAIDGATVVNYQTISGLDTTADITVTVYADWGAADAQSIITTQGFFAEIIR